MEYKYVSAEFFKISHVYFVSDFCYLMFYKELFIDGMLQYLLDIGFGFVDLSGVW